MLVDAVAGGQLAILADVDAADRMAGGDQLRDDRFHGAAGAAPIGVEIQQHRIVAAAPATANSSVAKCVEIIGPSLEISRPTVMVGSVAPLGSARGQEGSGGRARQALGPEAARQLMPAARLVLAASPATSLLPRVRCG